MNRDETNRDNQIWRIRKVKSHVGGWVVERGWWYRSEKLVRDGVGPMRFHSSQQSHFHSEAAARARLALETTA